VTYKEIYLLKDTNIMIRPVKLSFQKTIVIKPIAPFDFELSVRKWGGWGWLTPFEEFRNGILWTGMRLKSKPVGLKLKSRGNIKKPKVEIRVFSQGRLSKNQTENLVKSLRSVLTADEDISEFYTLCEKHPVLQEVKKNLYGMHTGATQNLFDVAILAVTLQMAPVKRSLAMLYCLFERYGQKIRFDDREIILPPVPKTLDGVKEKELKEKCKLGYRAKFIKALSKEYLAGEFPEWEKLLEMKPESAKKELMKLTGIGDYSADILNPHPGFPIDIWSVKIFCDLLSIKKTKSDRDMIPIVKRWAEKNWGKHKRIAFDYILHDLESLKKKFGIAVGNLATDYT
jgi:3-methyladenine DNA glycosylase/8-oxoguanine DNA glycosylase